MMPSKKYRFHQMLGQSATGTIAQEAAKGVVSQAEPAVRRILAEERVRLSDSVKAAIPFAAFSALTFLGTEYIIPKEDKWSKTAGYVASVAMLAAGAWWFAENEAGEIPETVQPSPLTALTQPLAQAAAKDIVAEAEPLVKRLVQEERAHAAEAVKAGLPYAGLSAATFLGTAFFVSENQQIMKLAGYAVSAGLLLLSVWVTMDKESEIPAAA